MHKGNKGIKGLQKLPPKEVKSERSVIYFTASQKQTLIDYCKKNNTTPSELIRERLKDIIKD